MTSKKNKFLFYLISFSHFDFFFLIIKILIQILGHTQITFNFYSVLSAQRFAWLFSPHMTEKAFAICLIWFARSDSAKTHLLLLNCSYSASVSCQASIISHTLSEIVIYLLRHMVGLTCQSSWFEMHSSFLIQIPEMNVLGHCHIKYQEPALSYYLFVVQIRILAVTIILP